MAQKFLRSEDILEKYGKALAGKTVLITGVAETSIAGELALQISAADPKLLILSARTKSHVDPIVKKIAEKKPGVATRFLPMDLSDLSAVRKAVQNDLSDIQKIDHVACVAGVMYCPYETTKDGFELQFGVNYVANFLLIKYLLPKVEAAGSGSSINIVTSGAAKTAKVNLDGLYSHDKESYRSVIAYSESNVDRVMFAKLLGQKLKSIGVRVHSVDPGLVITGLQRHITPELMAAFQASMRDGMVPDADGNMIPMPLLTGHSESAANIITGMIDPTTAEFPGTYINRNAVADNELPSQYKDESNWTTLWEKTEDLIGEKFSISSNPRP